jgi:hypothetical protein
MNVVRDLISVRSIRESERVLECFWESQIKSKRALIDLIKARRLFMGGDVFIFGGWYGMLAQMIVDEFPDVDLVCSVDIDPKCEEMGRRLSSNDPRIKFVTADMAAFNYQECFDRLPSSSLIINTSTEHVDQATFDKWLAGVPSMSPVILQGNNYYELAEHIRCADSLEDFKRKNYLKYVDKSMVIDCGNFERYMTMGWVT